jgi:dTDP-4-amino-4,6-dideoxygalactose transaminase
MTEHSVPFVDLKSQNHVVAGQINNAIESIIADCAFIRGRAVAEFERKFAEFCHAKHCIGVGNGTDALFTALKSMGLGPGHEVILPANTFIATAEAVTLTGARVVFVDCDPKDYNIDVSLIEDKISSRTKAIIPVHLYGLPADLPAILQIARKHDLKVIQDCAQAHGAECDRKPLAYYGDVLCFSFYPGKNLGAFGDAGAIVTNSDDIARKVTMMANHGRIDKYDHEFEGFNSRMDGLQGAVLNVKLNHLDQWNRQRQECARIYGRLLKGLPGIHIPDEAPDNAHVYHLYVIRCERRDAMQTFLGENGIATGIHYPIALPNLKAYRYLGHHSGDFPVAGRYQDEILSLPMYPGLSQEMITYVTEKIREFAG